MQKQVGNFRGKVKFGDGDDIVCQLQATLSFRDVCFYAKANKKGK